MKNTPLSKITIKDITDECGISRNAFYYHFSDKYALVNWIFLSETLPVINKFSAPDRYFDGFVALCKHLLENRQFYLEAFSYSGQNSLWDTLTESYYELIKIHISTVYAQLGYRLTDDELFIVARMETHAYVGIIKEWIQDGMSENYITYFEKLKAIKAGLAFPLVPFDDHH
ncbi:MAG: TetR/AcrR family transcriptional regulator C-terminal domain-containing protein [Saccharofermentanales bacterium]|jgi:probable dihydroxyacetone kinase regulator